MSARKKVPGFTAGLYVDVAALLDQGLVTMTPLPPEIRKVNGICPNCGNPSHWSNADHGYVHANCETSA